MTVIITTTKICIIQNLMTKHHLNGRDHYGSMIWVHAFLNEVRTQTKRCWKQTYRRGESKPHVGLIKIKSHLGGAHFDDKFVTFGVTSCIMVPDPNFCMTLYCKISCWNHTSDYYTVQNPYNLTCWQLTPQHFTHALFWMAIFHLVVNENDFSVPFERHTSLKCHDIILHSTFYWHYKWRYEKLEHVIVVITWIRNPDTWRKTISGQKHIM